MSSIGERPSMALQGAGIAAMSPRGGLSVQDMEQRLSRYSKRPVCKIADAGHSIPGVYGGGAHTARSLLEENQRLSTMKKEKAHMERRASKELIDQIFERDRQNLEHDRQKQQKRRETHQALAQKYKSAIVQKELSMAQEYEKKLEHGPNEEFFPFVEGETVEKHRESQNTMLKDEMRDFLKTQRQSQPPREDMLMTAVSHKHAHTYSNVNAKSAPVSLESQKIEETKTGVAPHIGGNHPLFLSRNREHMSRRINDAHVRKAMEDKVELCKTQLEQLAMDRHREARSHEEGLMINDALRYDNALIKASERAKNAEFLRGQISERQMRADMERKEQRKECAGYWGPEEKNLQPGDIHQDHCKHLIHQMEVDQHRRLDDKHRKLQQEKKIVENSMAEMAIDRSKAVEKSHRQKKVLTQTWNNQTKIREAMRVVENIGN
eukprot:gnl/MRDRNA2_/MRDRNA2_89110_c0_seq1.p1 gnl/MRDRNA2_/MRDRNA2_89110_c0~~gnl/MRDRNA2_/MRDRNA2_89110_c0_seq1.p1  ORF type:complete len:436 (-),score=120.73 gnl/MRDRNA2_/MRDRNA2_89110_c0_seq1:411-1718(-)